MRYSLGLLFCLLWIPLFGQGVTLTANVRDGVTKETLIGAYVTISESQKAFVTDEYGNFSAYFSQPPAAEVQFTVSHLGYKTWRGTVGVSRDTSVTWYLTPATDTLITVQVLGKRAGYVPRSEGSTARIDVETIRRLPKLLGETDPIRSLQLLPGVQNGGEGSSALHVRGGSPDQNLLLLDDIPLIAPNHLGGFFSTIDADAINTVTLYKGGFPARYANRLSSIIDVRLKAGSPTKWSRNITLGMLSSKLSVSGPLLKDKLTVAANVRRTNLDLLSQAVALFQSDNSFVAGVYFYDGSIKLSYKPNDTNEFSLVSYGSHDNFLLRQRNRTTDDGGAEVMQFGRLTRNWGNKMVGFNWKRRLSPRLFANYTASATTYNYEDESLSDLKVEAEPERNRRSESFFTTQIQQYTLRLHHQLARQGMYRFGALINGYYFAQPRARLTATRGDTDIPSTVDSGKRLLYASSVGLYFEWLPRLGEDWSLNFGIHLNTYLVNNHTFYNPQPRLAASYQLTPRLNWFANYARMVQPLHLLSNNGAGAPTDLWLPATNRLPPSISDQLSTGFSLTSDPWILELEGFVKKLQRMVDFEDGATFFAGGGDWQDDISSQGTGNIAGLEMLIKYVRPEHELWFSYTLSSNRRTFPDINEGLSYPYLYDRPHQFSLLALWEPKPEFNASCNWIVESGNAITLPSARYEVEAFGNTPIVGGPADQSNFSFGPRTALLYAQRNNTRLPLYHRLDINFNFVRYVTKRGRQRERTFTFGVYNLYNRLNPYFLFYGLNAAGESVLNKVTLFPVLPYISYRTSLL